MPNDFEKEANTKKYDEEAKPFIPPEEDDDFEPYEPGDEGIVLPEPQRRKAKLDLYNLPLAFTLWAMGTPVEEIPAACGVPINTILRAKRQQRWGDLAIRVRSVSPQPVIVQAQINKIEQNREINYKQGNDLREMVDEAIASVRATKWTDTAKDNTTRSNILRTLAIAHDTLADTTARARGDLAGQKDISDRPAGTTINLIVPGIMNLPRKERNITPKPIEIEEK